MDYEKSNGSFNSPLKPLEVARDRYEAVGLWWGKALLSHHFDLGSMPFYNNSDRIALAATEIDHMCDSISQREIIVEHVSTFASMIATMVRETHISRLQTSDKPVDILVDTAMQAGFSESLSWEQVARLFPFNSSTNIMPTTVTMATLGETGMPKIIWPLMELKLD